jgi:hypothetical protein
MVMKPHVAPWGGEEGKKQHHLGIKNACALATNFRQEGFDVLILDVLSDEHAEIYRRTLGPAGLKIVRLMPSYDEILRRNRERLPARLKPEEIDFLYNTQSRFSSFDISIDNTEIPPSEIAETLLRPQ